MTCYKNSDGTEFVCGCLPLDGYIYSRACTKCGEFHDDLGYTEIDGKTFCDDCLEEYKTDQLHKAFQSNT